MRLIRRTGLACALGAGCLVSLGVHSQALEPSLTGLPVAGRAVVPPIQNDPLKAGTSPATATSGDVANAMTSNARETRWDASFAAFDAEDKKNRPKPGGVVFVGSSSIRLWADLQKDFQSMPILYKRGFGGSRLLDCANHLQRLVIPYKPELVVVYAGDNDLAGGRTPDDVLASLKAFVQGVRASLPDTRIAYISIKPSPSRFALLPAIRETNAKIKSYIGQTDNTDYIDIFTPMLTSAGQPRMELFRNDALHLNATGYALWTSVILSQLELPGRQTAAATSATVAPAAATSAAATSAAAAAK